MDIRQNVADNEYRGMNDNEVHVFPGVVRIGDFAFNDCGNLSALVIDEGLGEIGFRAFCGCARLNSVRFPGSLTQIGAGAFTGCTELERVEFARGTEQIILGENSFNGCRIQREDVVRIVEEENRRRNGQANLANIQANQAYWNGLYDRMMQGDQFLANHIEAVRHFGQVNDWRNVGVEVMQELLYAQDNGIARLNWGQMGPLWQQLGDGDLDACRKYCQCILEARGNDDVVEIGMIEDGFAQTFLAIFNNRLEHVVRRTIAAIWADKVVPVVANHSVEQLIQFLNHGNANIGINGHWSMRSCAIKRFLSEQLPDKTSCEINVFAWHLANQGN